MKVVVWSTTVYALLLFAPSGLSGQNLQTATQSVAAPGADIRKLAGGFTFTEGPVPTCDGGVLFTDWREGYVYKWYPDGTVSVVIDNSDGVVGMAWDGNGNLLLAAGLNRTVESMAPDGSTTVLASHYGGKRLNSPNDFWVDPRGGIYFTDPRYWEPDTIEQDGQHVYYITPDDGEIIRVIDDLESPNGVLGTPDGTRLYVGDYRLDSTFVYPIRSDGTLGEREIFAPIGSDGLAMDEEGNIYLSGTGNDEFIYVYDRNGLLKEKLAFPESPVNFCFGGPYNRTLFVTAMTSLYSLEMSVHGAK